MGACWLLKYPETRSRSVARMLMGMFLLVGAFFTFRLFWSFYEVAPDDLVNAGLLSALAVRAQIRTAMSS